MALEPSPKVLHTSYPKAVVSQDDVIKAFSSDIHTGWGQIHKFNYYKHLRGGQIHQLNYYKHLEGGQIHQFKYYKHFPDGRTHARTDAHTDKASYGGGAHLKIKFNFFEIY